MTVQKFLNDLKKCPLYKKVKGRKTACSQGACPFTSKKTLGAAAALVVIALAVLVATGEKKINFAATKNAPSVTALKATPASLLVVGNSYTYYNCGLNGYLSNFLVGDAIATQKASTEKAARKLFKTRIATLGRGNLSQYPIEELFDNDAMKSHSRAGKIEASYRTAEIKKREKYDLVLLQASNRGMADQARDSAYLPEHVKAIRAQGGEAALIMTWPQKVKNAPSTALLRDATVSLANQNNILLIPVGLAFEECEKAWPDIRLIRNDNTHPTAAGSFLEAATIYASLYKRNPATAQKAFWKTLCDHPLSEYQRERLCAVAYKTVNAFFGRQDDAAQEKSVEKKAVSLHDLFSVQPKVTELGVENPARGLFVGNSYTYYNCGIGSYVKGFINKKAGHEWKARMQTISAGRLYQHPIERYFDNDEESLKDYNRPDKPKFDVVFLQAQSREPYDYGKNSLDSVKAPPALYKAALKKATNVVRANGAVPVVVLTWASKKSPAGYDMETETRALADFTIAAANENNAIVLPVGLAFEMVRNERPDIMLHNMSDLKHPSANGSYLFGAMIAGLLYKESPSWVGKAWRGECDKPIDEETAIYLQDVAWRVLKTFYGW